MSQNEKILKDIIKHTVLKTLTETELYGRRWANRRTSSIESQGNKLGPFVVGQWVRVLEPIEAEGTILRGNTEYYISSVNPEWESVAFSTKDPTQGSRGSTFHISYKYLNHDNFDFLGAI